MLLLGMFHAAAKAVDCAAQVPARSPACKAASSVGLGSAT